MSFFWGDLGMGPARLNRWKLRYRPMHLWTQNRVSSFPSPSDCLERNFGSQGRRWGRRWLRLLGACLQAVLGKWFLASRVKAK